MKGGKIMAKKNGGKIRIMQIFQTCYMVKKQAGMKVEVTRMKERSLIRRICNVTTVKYSRPNIPWIYFQAHRINIKFGPNLPYLRNKINNKLIHQIRIYN